MLEAARVEVGDVIVRGVIALDAVREREVQRRAAEHGELRQVGIVRQHAIHGHRQRRGRHVRHLAQHADHVEVPGARLEHVRAPARPPRLEVECHANVLRPRVLAHERRCAKQARLFTVSDERDHVVREWRPRLERAQRLENCGRAGGVVARGGRSGDAVVMGHQHDRESARRPSRESREHVFHLPGLGVARPDARGLLDLGRESEGTELREQILADPRVLGAPDRVWPLRDLAHVAQRPLGGEVSGGRRGRDRRRGKRGAPNE